jgi:NTP pyrophosphatase (non-canonical NTP hydrolase)
MKTYLVVTNDKFEHPVKEIVGSKEVAEFLGIQRQTFSKYMTNGFPKCHEYKAVVIKEVQYETEEEKKERQKYNFQKWYAKQDISERNEYARNYARLRRKRDIKRRVTMDNAIKQIADKYGYDAQSRQLIEECAELTQAVNKLWRLEQVKNRTVTQDIDLSFAKEHLVEELADVSIMVEQMLYLLDCKCDFEIEKAKKIKRQLERMKSKQEVEAV